MRKRYLFRARGKTLELGERTRLMGILNVTPDSFSDGGRFVEPGRAVEHGLRLLEEGAEILDVGGESTRPGSTSVPPEVELERVVPVVAAIRPHTKALISVDTYKAVVAEAALEAGADIVNDVSGFRFDPAMPEVVARYEAGVVLMHMRGTPSDMHTLPPSPDIAGEVRRGLQTAVQQADGVRISRDRILLDPGLGFGKNTRENLLLLRRLPGLAELDLPWLVGPSRKRFIGDVLKKPVSERLWGTAAVCAFCVLQGVHVLRVHDVGPIRQVVDMIDALAAGTMD